MKITSKHKLFYTKWQTVIKQTIKKCNRQKNHTKKSKFSKNK